jgi:diguanylate cyclase (GGDEF)-like protein
MNSIISLDIRTVFFTQVIVNLIIGLALWFSTLGRYQHGLNYFIGLFLSQAIAQVLLFLRGILPDFVTIVIANTFVAASYNLGYLGYCHFFNHKVNWWTVILPIATIFILFAIYIDDFRIRVISLGLVSAAQYIVQFILLLTITEKAVKRSKPILLLGYGIIIVLFTLRAIYMMIYPDGITSLFDTIWINSVTLFATIPSIIFIALGLLLMVSDRLLEENRELATRDSLTHLFNRRTFNDLAQRELARAERYNHATSMLMIDIDRFKLVNDTYGHPVGDEALIHLVRVLKDSVRMQDLYGRYGGEEFTVLLAETSQKEALEIAERLREQIAENSLVINNHTIKLTVSIGVATSHGDQKPSLDAMINAADEAMYIAKKAGRNCTRTVDLIPSMVDNSPSI